METHNSTPNIPNEELQGEDLITTSDAEDGEGSSSSSSSGALSPLPTSTQQQQRPQQQLVSRLQRDASGIIQMTSSDDNMTIVHGDNNNTEREENNGREEEETTFPQQDDGDDDGQNESPGDDVPRGSLDPPPSRVTSPLLQSEDQPGEVPSLSNSIAPQEAREQEAEGEIDQQQTEIATDGEPTAISEPTTSPEEQRDHAMSPNLPSMFPVEKPESSEESLSVQDIMQKDQDEEMHHKSQQPEQSAEEKDRIAMPPPRRLSESSEQTGEYAPGLAFVPQSHPLMTTSALPVELRQQAPASYIATYGYPIHAHAGVPAPPLLPNPSFASAGRRKIRLRLCEEVDDARGHRRTGSFLFRRSIRNLDTIDQTPRSVHRGTVTVSWFEGTSSMELQEHVRKCVMRKMGLSRIIRLDDMRIIDETMDPPEEIVLSTFIPDGSDFLLRFRTREKTPPPMNRYDYSQTSTQAPLSPSAAPSPLPSSEDLAGLNAAHLSLLGANLQGSSEKERSSRKLQASNKQTRGLVQGLLEAPQTPNGNKEINPDDDAVSKLSTDVPEEEVLSMSPEGQIEARLQQLTELLLTDREGRRQRYVRQEKKQVIFVLANYFVLFLSLIAISAEIQSRAPRWMAWMERNLESVQTCATDRDSLYDCVSNGDFSGLIASFILWFGRSAATKRFFLFGFETPKRLWTVVYEALVTAVCWGVSYMFIRRGMNPDTRPNFLQKYWKDAVYGSLAGFNASFLKAVLKNLIPQEALQDALQDRQLKILSWLPSFHH